MGKLLDKIRGLRKPARPFCTTVVVAAGQSRRMGKDKLLLPLGEGTVLEHTLRAVDASERTDEIILVTREDLLVPLAELCKGCALQKPVKVIRGGETRTESVMAGALEADPRAELIAVHDGARPLITPELFDAVVESAGVTGASAPAVPVTDTIKVADENGIVRSTPERRTLFAVQTPQVFQAELLKAADVSASSFQNIFRSKDGVLTEFVAIMFGGQFGVARSIADSKLPPVYAYAVETAIQLTLTELNENLREIYIEAYSLPDTSEYIYLHTTAELKQIFGENFPDDTESDFYEMEIGTAGLMRSYMARKCDIHFPLERKLSRFLTAAMRVYRVPEAEQAKVLAFIQSLDIKAIATEVMYKLFAMLEMKYDFKLSKDSKGEETI